MFEVSAGIPGLTLTYDTLDIQVTLAQYSVSPPMVISFAIDCNEPLWVARTRHSVVCGQDKSEMAPERSGIDIWGPPYDSYEPDRPIKFYSISWADLLTWSTGWSFPPQHPNLQLYCHFSLPNVITPCYIECILPCTRRGFDGVPGNPVRKRRCQRAGAWRQTLLSGPSICSGM